MPPRKPKYQQFIAAFPPPSASPNDVQDWILSWSRGNLLVTTDTAPTLIKDRIELMYWDGLEIRKNSKREIALHIKWMYADAGIMLEGKTETLVNALVDDIEKAKATELKNTPKRFTWLEPCFMLLLAAAIIYLGTRSVWVLWEGKEPEPFMSSLDQVFKVTCVCLMGWFTATWLEF